MASLTRSAQAWRNRCGGRLATGILNAESRRLRPSGKSYRGKVAFNCLPKPVMTGARHVEMGYSLRGSDSFSAPSGITCPAFRNGNVESAAAQRSAALFDRKE
jgi:hypothetical protein